VTDPLDQPEGGTEYGLLFPFVVCQSQGGPYDDEAFVAGAQFGRIDQALQVAAVSGATRLRVTVRTDLVKQLELCGMARGFPVLIAEQVEETPDYPAMPEWSFVTLATEAD
jgi:hypothetical protein